MKHTQPATDPALVLDIMAQLFASGSSLAAGLAAVGKHLPGCQPLTKVARLLLLGLDWDTAWTHADDIPQLNQLAEELRFEIGRASCRERVTGVDLGGGVC